MAEEAPGEVELLTIKQEFDDSPSAASHPQLDNVVKGLESAKMSSNEGQILHSANSNERQDHNSHPVEHNLQFQIKKEYDSMDGMC